jgi:hypothetical protein
MVVQSAANSHNSALVFQRCWRLSSSSAVHGSASTLVRAFRNRMHCVAGATKHCRAAFCDLNSDSDRWRVLAVARPYLLITYPLHASVAEGISCGITEAYHAVSVIVSLILSDTASDLSSEWATSGESCQSEPWHPNACPLDSGCSVHAVATCMRSGSVRGP